MSQCPACNGLINLEESCKACGGRCTDRGCVEDFYGPYRPYLEESNAENCTHVLLCSCGYSITWPVQVIG